MTDKVKKLLDNALDLSEADRALLAASLIDSLEPADDLIVEASWEIEVSRRISELDSGATKSIPWGEALERLCIG